MNFITWRKNDRRARPVEAPRCNAPIGKSFKVSTAAFGGLKSMITPE